MGVGCRVLWPALLTVRWPGLGSLSLSSSTVAAPRPERPSGLGPAPARSTELQPTLTNGERRRVTGRAQHGRGSCPPFIAGQPTTDEGQLSPPPLGQPGLTSDPRQSPSPAGRRTRTESRPISLGVWSLEVGLEVWSTAGRRVIWSLVCLWSVIWSVVCDLVCGL